jgi:hypothetical protein
MLWLAFFVPSGFKIGLGGLGWGEEEVEIRRVSK